MKKKDAEQLTIRAVPRRVGARLRERARQEGKSLNTAAVEALARGVGRPDEDTRFTDLDDLAGTWVDDPAFDRAIAEMDAVDRDLWK
jgi:plasmid stability protein